MDLKVLVAGTGEPNIPSISVASDFVPIVVVGKKNRNSVILKYGPVPFVIARMLCSSRRDSKY